MTSSETSTKSANEAKDKKSVNCFIRPQYNWMKVEDSVSHLRDVSGTSNIASGLSKSICLEAPSPLWGFFSPLRFGGADNG
ncbi:hypothetical protein TNIN_220811 [Trichonephila inaurata madagascariensis]|uniref:Uncharacterized protein n=1 Tax=Trichonephila inaurata madagascariensis TaxID=2747483 RepID=A0A8X7CED8_9ARAC|nr:hypothetical protein TNIN_220811 [Trichonephila inaurata madagascariensis]